MGQSFSGDGTTIQKAPPIIVVVTARTEPSTNTYVEALKKRAAAVYGEKQLDLEILGVTDPVSILDGQPIHVGSGGATVNALLVAAEHLTARQGEATVSGEILKGVHVLVVHAGGEEQHAPPFFPYAKAFDSPSTTAALHIDRLLRALEAMCAGANPGLWVCSTQGILSSSEYVDASMRCLAMISVISPFCFLVWVRGWLFSRRCQQRGVTVFAASGSYEEAKDHGVYSMAPDGTVKRVLFQPHREEEAGEVATAIQAEGSGEKLEVPLVVGVAYFDTQAAGSLLDISNTVPMDGCTYLGVDSGAMMPFGYSLFLDVLQACVCLNAGGGYLAALTRRLHWVSGHGKRSDERRVRSRLSGRENRVSSSAL